MGSLSIKRVVAPTLAELDELARYDEEAFGHTGLRSFDLGIVARAGAVFVGLLGRRIAASCQLLRMWDDPAGFWVFGFYVRPAYHRRGFGREFLEGVAREVAAAGGESIVLSVAPENRAALDLYLSFGFEVIDEVTDFYGPGEHRRVLRLDLARAKTMRPPATTAERSSAAGEEIT